MKESNFFAGNSFHMEKLNKNFADFLRLLNEKQVKYLVVGGYAVGFHGFVRATGDLDVFVEISEENAKRLVAVFLDFGFTDAVLTKELFLKKGTIIRIGIPPLRVEVLNDIDGVSFAECYHGRIEEEIDDLRISFIDLKNLIKNKQASGRPKDIADLHELTKKIISERSKRSR